MKRLWSLLIAVFIALAAFDDAGAAPGRLGGGKSVGRQSSNVTQRDAQQPARQQPAQAQPNSPAQPAPAAAPQPTRPGWGGMIGGLAAGLGLAWLAHSLGFGAGFANVLLLLLVGMIVLMVIGAMRARRQAPATVSPYSWQPASQTPEAAPPLRQYNPEKVGNDASARPWERSSMAFEAAKYGNTGVKIGSGLQGSQGWGVPAGFDTEGFIASAKRNFVTLQDAWDHADLNMLRTMMTDQMMGEIRGQLAEREAKGPSTSSGQALSPNRTEVAMLEAQLLGIEELDGEYMASVEFSGMIREDPSTGPSPFREVWNMTKPKDGSTGWLVAGVQALQ